MKTSDKFVIGTFVSLISLEISILLMYDYQMRILWYVMSICIMIFIMFVSTFHPEESTEHKPPFY